MTMVNLQPSPAAANILRQNAAYGVSQFVCRGVVRVLANNPKDYTGPGTNTYIVGDDKVWIIDPGPNCLKHIAAVEKAVKGRDVLGVFVTHSHMDHSPAAQILSQIFSAPVLGMASLDPETIEMSGEDIDPSYCPDHILADGDRIGEGDFALKAIHTPGHFPNHLCLWLASKRYFFTGDHILGWSTTVIVPPLGNLADYLESLRKILTFNAEIMLPSHGDTISNPAERVKEIVRHRAMRHAQVGQCLQKGMKNPKDIVKEMYVDLTPRLIQAACGQVQAHIDLYNEDQNFIPGI